MLPWIDEPFIKLLSYSQPCVLGIQYAFKFLEYLVVLIMLEIIHNLKLNWQLTLQRSTFNIFKNVCLNSNRNVPVAALPVTQQMTEMSISREDKITTPKTEVSEPGMLFV